MFLNSNFNDLESKNLLEQNCDLKGTFLFNSFHDSKPKKQENFKIKLFTANNAIF